MAGLRLVAPRVGAWIETYPEKNIEALLRSHPVWVRGLKQHAIAGPAPHTSVAPRVGAWIETVRLLQVTRKLRPSHPVWVRGLKHI